MRPVAKQPLPGRLCPRQGKHVRGEIYTRHLDVFAGQLQTEIPAAASGIEDQIPGAHLEELESQRGFHFIRKAAQRVRYQSS